jgi:hypothetical protein
MGTTDQLEMPDNPQIAFPMAVSRSALDVAQAIRYHTDLLTIQFWENIKNEE